MSEESTGYCQITLDPKLASRAAPDLYAQLASHRTDTVVLDASKVEQIGVLSMQILVAAAKTWPEAGLEFEVVDPSPAFCASAETIGIELTLMGVKSDGEAVHGVENSCG